jgi:hypothetical protein
MLPSPFQTSKSSLVLTQNVTPLVTKEMQIKTMFRFHLTPVRTACSRAITTTNAGKDVVK